MKHIRHPEQEPQEPDAQREPSAELPPGRIACKQCGALLPQGAERCVICGTKPGKPKTEEIPPPSRPPWQERLINPAQMRQGRRANLMVSLLMIAVLLVSGLGVGAHEYLSYQKLITDYTADKAVVYRQGNSLLKIALPAFAEPVTLGDLKGYGSPMQVRNSHDGRYLLYLNNQARDSAGDRWLGDLFLLDLVQLDDPGAAHEGVLMESQVADLEFSSRRDYFAYVTGEGELMLCDYGGLGDILPALSLPVSRQVDSGVSGIASFDGRTLLYYKGERTTPDTWQENSEGELGRPLDLYYTVVGDEPVPPTQIASGLYRVEDATAAYDRVIYTKRIRSLPLPLYDIYLYQQKTGESRLLAADVRHVVDASADRGGVIYLSPTEETFSFKDLFDDDLQEADMEVTEPDPVTYGILDRFGNEVQGLDGVDREELMDKFDEDYDRYRSKARRDRLRRYLRDEIRGYMQENYLSYSLHYASDSEQVKVAEHLYNWKGDHESLAVGSVEGNYVLYASGDRETMEQRTLSSLSSDEINAMLDNPYDLLDALSRSMPQVLRYAVLDGEAQDVFTESGPRYLTRFYPAGATGGFYFCSADYASGLGSLYFVDNGETLSEKVLYVDEDVGEVIGMGGGQNSGLFYQKTVRGAFPTRSICRATRSQSKALVTDVEGMTGAHFEGDQGQYLLYFQVGSDGKRRLYFYDSQNRQIAQGIEEAFFIAPEKIYLLSAANGGSKTLSLYENGTVTSLDEAVSDSVYLTR